MSFSMEPQKGSEDFDLDAPDLEIFSTSSANVGYVPQAQIEIPESAGVNNCSEVNYESSELIFLQAYCQGDFCIHHDTKEDCENVDVVLTENGNLKEESGQDGVADCVWVSEATS